MHTYLINDTEYASLKMQNAKRDFYTLGSEQLKETVNMTLSYVTSDLNASYPLINLPTFTLFPLGSIYFQVPFVPTRLVCFLV